MLVNHDLAFIHDLSDYESAARIDLRAIETLSAVLEGSDRPLVIASGTLALPAGHVGTERDEPDANGAMASRIPSAQAALSLAELGVRSSILRLPPSVHGEGDHGFLAALITIARQSGVSSYIGDGTSRWPAVHRLDAAHLARLVLEKAPAGTVLHEVADEGVPLRSIAEVIGRHLNLPVTSISPGDAGDHFGWLAMFLGADAPASSALTRNLLGWQPTHPGLIDDLDQGHYFNNTKGRIIMTETSAARGPFRVDVIDDMTIEWDVPIETDDGVTLRADVFRPTATGTYPTIVSYGPYAKGLPFQQGFPAAWHKMITDHPNVVEGSSGKYQNWELVDPEKWVPDGYVRVRVDSRGSGRSPGYLDPFSERETRDFYECIEWAAAQPWSNGLVGLNGISYYAINQWQVAALQPPHLTAICVWEGAGDWYRDQAYHGGIRSSFIETWYSALVANSQYGLGEKGGRNPLTGQLICGDETFSEHELAQRHVDLVRVVSEHPFLDEYHCNRTPDWTRINVPLLSAGNWGGQGLHLRGNTRGYELAASADKWLEMHDDTHWSLFYAQYGLDLQKRFLGHFLKGEDTGWTHQPRVQLRTRHVDGHTEQREASQWPLPDTEWTRLYLDASDCSMRPDEPPDEAAKSYDAEQGQLSFTYVCPHDLEIAGPVAARLYVESPTTDVDLFLVVLAFSPDGTEVVYPCAIDPHTPIAHGWLRASHRALDNDQSRPFLPVHRHDRTEPLTPAKVYEVNVEIWPTSVTLPAGYALTLDVQGHDYVYPGAAAMQPSFSLSKTLHLLIGKVCQLRRFFGCPAQLKTPFGRNELPIEEAIQKRHL